jgi:predicted nucleic acid-binding protein
MIVVAGSSPLIGLCRIGKVQLLREVFGRVIVPEAVWREIVIDGSGKAGAAEMQEATWFEVVAVKSNLPAVPVLELVLDRGEAEAIA